MAENKEAAHEQVQSLKKSPSRLHRWIPGEHTESVIKLEDFIKVYYSEDEYIKGRFLVAVQQFDDSEHVNSKQYDIFQRAMIILSALTSFFIALEAIIIAPLVLKLIALLLSLLVGILGNYLTSFNIQVKRGAYRRTRESLITEIYKFHEGIKPYSTATDTGKNRTLFVTEVEMIIQVANENWGKLHQADQADQVERSKH